MSYFLAGADVRILPALPLYHTLVLRNNISKTKLGPFHLLTNGALYTTMIHINEDLTNFAYSLAQASMSVKPPNHNKNMKWGQGPIKP